jgi:2-polyprenyl-3-methyl-5-hydroxy-6-metoxy-1,4-benzoquinol methylase
MMDIKDAKELNECLCCGSERLKLILDLNEQPMANSFKASPDDAELTFPLRLNLCEDCTHLQLSHAVNPDLLFKNYLYVSGTSQTLRDYFDWFAKETTKYFSIPPTSVLDIACNDGSQLNSFKALGLKTYGIDPAENLHSLSNANHEVVCDYFKEKYVYHYKNKNLDIITAQNVFAHNDYPLDFLLQCKEIMSDNTRLFIQTSQADMIKNNEFDTIYHEHLSFFNSSSMKALADRAGLFLVDIRKTPIHGNSYMFVFGRQPGNPDEVNHTLKLEREAGLQDLNTYLAYADRCKEIVQDLEDTIAHYRGLGYVIAGYGAAAKGMTLINFGHLELDFIIDDNPLKQGKFCPGSNIPVVPVDILDECADVKVAFIPLAWNFFAEIRRNIKNKRDQDGDVFIRYFPTIKFE